MSTTLFRRTGLISVCVLAVGMLASVTNQASGQQSSSAHQHAGSAEPALPDRGVTLAEMTEQADVIVVGKVSATASSWAGGRATIQTVATITVDEALKGDIAGSQVQVTVPGGEVDGIGEWYSHSTRFAKDEDVVLFAKKDASGALRIRPGSKGKFSVIEDKASGMRMVASVGTLKDFTAEIRHILSSPSRDQK